VHKLERSLVLGKFIELEHDIVLHIAGDFDLVIVDGLGNIFALADIANRASEQAEAIVELVFVARDPLIIFILEKERVTLIHS
jgi:hypothetical protein